MKIKWPPWKPATEPRILQLKLREQSPTFHLLPTTYHLPPTTYHRPPTTFHFAQPHDLSQYSAHIQLRHKKCQQIQCAMAIALKRATKLCGTAGQAPNGKGWGNARPLALSITHSLRSNPCRTIVCVLNKWKAQPTKKSPNSFIEDCETHTSVPKAHTLSLPLPLYLSLSLSFAHTHAETPTCHAARKVDTQKC